MYRDHAALKIILILSLVCEYNGQNSRSAMGMEPKTFVTLFGALTTEQHIVASYALYLIRMLLWHVLHSAL